jgi:hypothetical protein
MLNVFVQDIWAQPEFKPSTSQIVRSPPRGREEISSLLAQKIPDEVGDSPHACPFGTTFVVCWRVRATDHAQ